MKVGSDNAIYSLFVPRARNAPSVVDQKIGTAFSQPPKAQPVRTDAQLTDDFYARLTKQQVDWADTDKDGKVTKSEYMDGQSRLAQLDGRPFDSATSEGHWAKLDATGKGWLNEDELREGLERMLPVGVGHLDAGYAERLRTRQA
ncbi:MAG: EF-hand domain-containing protein [Rhizobium sp.]|jgi:hypothetical protein|uniref:hypothetical protein n=1 Tax=Rhizobium sp. TaxID=391 RepID=UPI00056A97DB